MREQDIPRIGVPKREECDYTLRYAMNVDWIRPIMEVPRRAVFSEKVIPIKFEAALDMGVKFR